MIADGYQYAYYLILLVFLMVPCDKLFILKVIIIIYINEPN